MKARTQEGIIQEFSNLPYKKQVVIMWGALDHMEQFNGRTKLDCVCLSMGYTPNNESKWEETI